MSVGFGSPLLMGMSGGSALTGWFKGLLPSEHSLVISALGRDGLFAAVVVIRGSDMPLNLENDLDVKL